MTTDLFARGHHLWVALRELPDAPRGWFPDAPNAEAIFATALGLAHFLCEKNASYGDSVFNPVRIFSKVDAVEQLNVRIDDKFNRLLKGHELPNEDTELDLLGYLLLKFAMKASQEGETDG